MMNFLDDSHCAVCREEIVRRTYSIGQLSPMANPTPASTNISLSDLNFVDLAYTDATPTGGRYEWWIDGVKPTDTGVPITTNLRVFGAVHFVARSYYLNVWNNWSPTLLSNNAHIHAGEAFAHPGHLAVPATDKQWLAVSAQELPPLPIGSVAANLVAITPPQQGGFVFLHRAATGHTVAEVTMDRAGTRVAYLKTIGDDRPIEVVDLDRELTVTASRAGGQGVIDISIPCAANEICILAGAYGLAALPATLPGFRGQFELDNSYQTLHVAVGTGTPVTWSSSLPDTPAMVGIKLCYQAMRTNATITSGDFSRVAWLRWF